MATAVNNTPKKIVLSTNWFEVEEKRLGQHPTPYFVLNCTDYVSIVARTDDDQLVLVRQFRPAIEEYTLELPSGHVEPGETALSAIVRELSEETGYVADSIDEMGVLRPDAGRLSNRLHCFFAKVRRSSNKWRPESGIESITMSRASVLESLASAAPMLRHAHCMAAIGMAILQSRL
jgi:ADP-ribose pyrophosphatase